jgi:nitrogen-specific signal transduction histidine kinase
MRSKAESLTNVIFENTHNIIIILDGNMYIKEVNPPGERIFHVNSADIKDKHISVILDGSDFYKVKETGNNILKRKIELTDYGVVLLQNIIYLEKQDIILAIMIDITAEETSKKELSRVREKYT